MHLGSSGISADASRITLVTTNSKVRMKHALFLTNDMFSES